MTKRDREAQRKWRLLTRGIVRADTAAAKARNKLLTFAQDHLRKRPLSQATLTELLTHVELGRPLCCESGREYLDKTVDPIWAAALNGWAYEGLSCRDSRDHVSEYTGKLTAIVTEYKALAEYVDR